MSLGLVLGSLLGFSAALLLKEFKDLFDPIGLMLRSLVVSSVLEFEGGFDGQSRDQWPGLPHL